MGLSNRVKTDSLPIEDQSLIVNNLWPTNDHSTPVDFGLWKTYLSYYMNQCNEASEDEGRHMTVRNHQDVIDIAKDLQAGCTKSDLKQKLTLLKSSRRTDDEMNEMAEGSTRLAVRLVAMTDVGRIGSKRLAGHEPVPWNEQQNLSSALAMHFGAGSSVPKTSQFDQYFSAFSIRRFAGLEIIWTDDLAQHLRLIDYDRKLCILHHVTFLRHHADRVNSQKSPLFPDGFLEETLRTLALLFPSGDKNTEHWIKRESQDNEDSCDPDIGVLDFQALMADDRRIEKFKFWRDELVTLKEKYEQPRPTSISQFWHDDRNKVQWYTFWAAILVLFLTIFFGLVQSIEGALQVHKAYHPVPG